MLSFKNLQIHVCLHRKNSIRASLFSLIPYPKTSWKDSSIFSSHMNTLCQSGLCGASSVDASHIWAPEYLQPGIFVVQGCLPHCRNLSEEGQGISGAGADYPFPKFQHNHVLLRPRLRCLPKVISAFHLMQDIMLPVFFPFSPTLESEKILHLDAKRALLFYI